MENNSNFLRDEYPPVLLDLMHFKEVNAG